MSKDGSCLEIVSSIAVQVDSVFQIRVPQSYGCVIVIYCDPQSNGYYFDDFRNKQCLQYRQLFILKVDYNVSVFQYMFPAKIKPTIHRFDSSRDQF